MKKGFTLIETLIIVAIVAIIGVYAFMLIVQNTGLYYSQNSIVDQGVHINNVLANINSSIRNANAIASGYPSQSPVYTSSAQTIVLKIPAVDSSNNFLDNVYDYSVYYFDTDKLRYKVFPDAASSRSPSDQILAYNVSWVLLQYFDSSGSEVVPTSASRVKLSITLKQKAGASMLEKTATTEAYLRND